MTKQISITGRARAAAQEILETLAAIGTLDHAAKVEVERCQDISIPLASAITCGFVTRVSQEGLDELESGLAEMRRVLEHGLPLWLETKAHQTILEVARSQEAWTEDPAGEVLVLEVKEFNAKVTRPGTLEPAPRRVPLLWAPLTTRILRQTEVATKKPVEVPAVVAGRTSFTKDGQEYILVQFEGNQARPVVTGSRVYGRDQRNGLVFEVRSVDGPADLDGFPTLVVSKVMGLNNRVVDTARTTAGPDQLQVAWVLDNHLIQWAA